MLTARLLFAAVCCTGVAFSASIQHSVAIEPFIAVHRPSPFPPLVFALELPKFDPGLGTLQNVDIEATGNITGYAVYENLSMDKATLVL